MLTPRMLLPMRAPDTDSRYNVCLFGVSIDVSNLGVRALAGALFRLALDCRPDARLFAMYGNRTDGSRKFPYRGGEVEVRVVNYRLSPRAKLREHLLSILCMSSLYRVLPIAAVRRRIENTVPWIKAIVEADFIGDIRGGDSFSDIYGLRRMLEGSAQLLPIFVLGKKLVLLPQTYGPFEHPLSRVIARAIIKRAPKVYSRDRESMEYVKSLMGKGADDNRLRFCPDVAFMLEPVEAPHARIDPPLSHQNKPLIGINISGLLYMGGYTGKNEFGLRCDYKMFVSALIRRVLDETDAHVLIVPHVTRSLDDDLEPEVPASLEVWSQFGGSDRERVHLLEGDYNQSEVKSIIGRCDFFIGSRMHACIAALSQGIPSVGLAYSRKFKGVFESVGAGDMVVDAREKDEGDLVEECLRRFQERERVVAILQSRMPAIQAEIRDNFLEAFGLEVRGSLSAGAAAAQSESRVSPLIGESH